MYSSFEELKACPKACNDLVIQSKEIFKCVAGESLLSELTNNRDTRGVIHLVLDAKQQEGGVIRVRRAGIIDNLGVINCQTLEGKESCPDSMFDDILLGEIRNAICMNQCGAWSLQQGSSFIRSRDEARKSLESWLVSILMKSFFNQLGSYTGNYTYYNGKKEPIVLQTRGFNEITPSTAHYRVVTTPANGSTPASSTLVNITGDIAGENNIQAKDKLTLSVIRQLKSLVFNDNNICGNQMLDRYGVQYVLFLHPTQIADLKSDPEWRNWICCADQKGPNNRLTTGAEGVIDGILIKSSEYVPYGVKPNGEPNLNVRRAILAGVDAVSLAIGGYKMVQDGNIVSVPFKLDYGYRDFNHYSALAISAIFGLKKTRFNNKDASALVISSYVPDSNVDNSVYSIDTNSSLVTNKKGS